jgi:hypothetical protein
MPKSDTEAARALLRRMDAELRELAGREVIEVDPAALQRLDAALFGALAWRDLPASNAHRGAAAKVLAACIELIASRPEWREMKLQVPLVELLAALNDLENGHVAAILKPNRKAGRPPSYFEGATRGHAAGIMGGLMKHGAMNKTRAAAWVAEKLTAAGWPRITAVTVADWRKEALENPRGTAGKQYTKAMQRTNWTQPEAAADRLLTNLLALKK